MKTGNKYIWWNGQIVPWNDAHIHVTSETASRGLNVFEGMRAYWRIDEKVYAIIGIEAHLKRLSQSADILLFPVSEVLPRFRKGIMEILKSVSCPTDVYLRPTIYMEQGAYELDENNIKLGEYISWRPEGSMPFRKMKCGISSWVRLSSKSLPSSAKIGAAYTAFRLARLEAKTLGYDEAILLNSDNRISETGGGSVFIVNMRDAVVSTPPLSEGILPSITRRIVLETLCPLLEIKTEQRPLTVNDLYEADEAFIAGTLDEISQVISIDQKNFSVQGSNSIVNQLQNSYHSLCFENKFDNSGWIEFFNPRRVGYGY